MKRRPFLKLSAALAAIASALRSSEARERTREIGKVPRPAEWPAPRGPWKCVHDKGEHACNGVAFYAVEMPIAGKPMNPENFRLLDGTKPRLRDQVICGTCGANLAREKVFPLTLMPRVPQPQPSRRVRPVS